MYSNTVTIPKTDTLTRNGIEATINTRVLLYGAVSVTGMEGNNLAAGITSQSGSTIVTYGNCTISGFGYQLLAFTGGTIENFSPSYTLSKGAGNTATNVRAINVSERSRFINNRGTTIIRNNGITDNVETVGTLVDYPAMDWEALPVTRGSVLSAGGTFTVHINRFFRMVAVRLEAVPLGTHSIGQSIASVAWPSGFFTGNGILRVACAIDLAGSIGRLECNLNFRADGGILFYDFYPTKMDGSTAGGNLYTDEIVRMF